MKPLLLILSALLAVGSAQAVLVADYDYTSESGADPTLQGWTYAETAVFDYLGGCDSQNGWRVIDASSDGYANYQIDLTDEQASNMKSGFSVSWTFRLDSNANQAKGMGSSADYFLPPNEERQNNNGLWIETSGEGSWLYDIVATADENGNLAINDGTTVHVLTSGGNNNGYDTEYTVDITYDGTDAVLSFGTSTFNLSKQDSQGDSRVLFGAHTDQGTGSVIYNAVSVNAVPEPATILLLGLGGLLLRNRK